MASYEPDCLLAAGGLGNHLHTLLIVENADDATTHQRVIIRHQNVYHPPVPKQSYFLPDHHSHDTAQASPVLRTKPAEKCVRQQVGGKS